LVLSACSLNNLGVRRFKSMNFFGILWVVSTLSSVLFPQTTPRILEDFNSKAIQRSATSLVRHAHPAAIQAKAQLFLNSKSAKHFSISGSISNPFSIATAASASNSSASPASQPFDLPSDTMALVHAESSDLIQQFIGGLLRRSDNIRSLFGRVTPVVTITIADNPCAVAQLSYDAGWKLGHLWNDRRQSKLDAANLVHCTGLWQTNWSQSPPVEQVFQVHVRGQVVAEAPTYVEAEAIARQLYQVLRQPNFTPYRLVPAIVNGVPTGKAEDSVLFSIKPDWATLLDRNPELLAIQWTNNLRTALDAPPLSLAEAQSQMYGLVPTDRQLTGVASWYGPYFHGRLTATGEVFNQHELTAAHPSLPFNTYLKVINQLTGKTVIVRINDRGPYFEDRSLDLSLEAARCLGSEVKGIVPYEAVIMEKADVAQFNQRNWTTASLIDRSMQR
jgi:hypothetical protein